MGLIGRALFAALAIIFSFNAAIAASEPEAVPGEYVVKLKSNLDVQSTDSRSLGVTLGSFVKSRIPGQNIVIVKRPVFEIRRNAVKQLNLNPNVEIAEPNYIYRINRMPNDPMLGQLWGLTNTGGTDSSGAAGVSGVDVGALAAWDIQTGSKDVVVAVIDTGVLPTQTDLVENMWTNEAELNGKPGVDDDKNGYVDDIHGYDFVNNDGDPSDDHGHGTHCAGTIGAKGNDGKGLVGVAWDVKIMGVKFLSADGSGTLEGAIKSIDYAVQNGAKILSNSWGGGGFSQTLKDAIDRSNAAGTLFVAAAGNESNNNDSNPSYPNSYDTENILSVAAINNRGQLASFSNYGRTNVHVGAPGVNIMSSTTAGYESWSGTSMATPHVSGIAALVLSNEPNISHLDLKNRIVATAKPIAGLRSKVRSGGIADAYMALTNTTPPPDQNDPTNWPTQPLSVSSPHPYKDNYSGAWTVKVPGAKQFALYFEKFETEAEYDVVVIKDVNGKIVDQLSGNNDRSFSSVIDGDTAVIEFKSDDSVNAYGFDITKAAFR